MRVLNYLVLSSIALAGGSNLEFSLEGGPNPLTSSITPTTSVHSCKRWYIHVVACIEFTAKYVLGFHLTSDLKSLSLAMPSTFLVHFVSFANDPSL